MVYATLDPAMENDLPRAGVITRRFLIPFLILVGSICGLLAVGFHELVELARAALIDRALPLHGLWRTAAVLERMLLGGKPLLSAPSGTWTDVRELAGFLVVGVGAGLLSGIGIRSVVRLRRFLRATIRPDFCALPSAAL